MFYFWSISFSISILAQLSLALKTSFNIFRPNQPLDFLESKYGSFSEELRIKMLDQAREMFYFGYDNYMKHAFPKDELNPILCTGRGPDYENP